MNHGVFNRLLQHGERQIRVEAVISVSLYIRRAPVELRLSRKRFNASHNNSSK